MALFRLLSFPSIPHFSTQQCFFYPTNSPSIFPSTSNSISPLLNTLVFRPQISSHSILRAAYSVQAQATIETPELEISDSGIEEEVEEEEDEASRTRLLAQNVPWSCTANDIRPLFEKYGTVVDVELSMYNKTRNRGLAFVTMGSHEEAVAAFNNLNSYEYEGRTLNLAWAKPKKKKVSPPPLQPKPLPVHNLFVANLPFQARAKDLKEFFNAENANVVSAEIIFHENPRGSAGYGFVSFNTKNEAEAALTAFNGKMFMGRPIRVARSKRFLRQETKASIQSEST